MRNCKKNHYADRIVVEVKYGSTKCTIFGKGRLK